MNDRANELTTGLLRSSSEAATERRTKQTSFESDSSSQRIHVVATNTFSFLQSNEFALVATASPDSAALGQTDNTQDLEPNRTKLSTVCP